jgi:hypothetical protein
MLNRLLQAATITFLLNLIAYINPQDTNQSTALLPSRTISKMVLSLRLVSFLVAELVLIC